MASITSSSSVTEGNNLIAEATGLTAGNKYSLYIYTSYATEDDYGAISIDGQERTKEDYYYYDWKAESNTSEISIPIIADSQDESNESMYVYLYGFTNSSWSSSPYRNYQDYTHITLEDGEKQPEKDPTIDATLEGTNFQNVTYFDEGSSIEFTLSDFNPDATYYYYEITGLDQADIDQNLNDSFWMNGDGKTTINIETIADSETEGDATASLLIYDNNYEYVKGYDFNVSDTSTSPEISVTSGSSYGDTSSPASINEGQTLYFEIKNAKPNIYYYTRISGVDYNDTYDSLENSLYHYSNSDTTSFQYSFLEDGNTEGDEEIKFEIYSDYYSTLVATVTTTLKDTSKTLIPKIELQGNSSDINEGENVHFKITNTKQYESYFYKITDSSGKFNENDVTDGYLEGYVYSDDTSSSVNVYVDLLNDFETEGLETPEFKLYTYDYNSNKQGTDESKLLVSQKFDVNDTSVDPVVSLNWEGKKKNNPSMVDEGDYLTFNLSNLSENQYWYKFEGVELSDVEFTTLSGKFQSYNGDQELYFSTLLDNLTEGDEDVSFKLSKDSNFQNIAAEAEFTLLDTSKDPDPKVIINASNIRSNEGESAVIPLSLTTFPTQEKKLYWKLSGNNLSSIDMANRFGDLSEAIDLSAMFTTESENIRGTNYDSGTYSLEIPFSNDETTEGTEQYLLEIYDDKNLSTSALVDSTNISVFDTSTTPIKTILNSSMIEDKNILLFFSNPIQASDISRSYFKFTIDGKPLQVKSIKVGDTSDFASITLNKEPDPQSIISIDYSPKADINLNSFTESITVDDNNKPIPTRAIAYTEKIELRFSEKLNQTSVNNSKFEVRSNNRIKKISSIEVDGDDGIVIINLKQKIDINDDLIEIDYYDLKSDQKGKVIEDLSGNDVETFKDFSAVNEAIDSDDIEVILAEVDENVLTLGFDIEIDPNSVPNTGMFRVKVNKNFNKVTDIKLYPKKREAALFLTKSVAEGDQISLNYIDARGNQKDNIIQSKYGGDLATIKNLKVDNLSASSVDPPEIVDAYYDDESSSIYIEFDEIIANSNIKKSRFKAYALTKKGKKLRKKIVGVTSQVDDSIAQIKLKSPINPSDEDLRIDYRDPKGDQKNGIIEDLQGNDMLSLKNYVVEI